MARLLTTRPRWQVDLASRFCQQRYHLSPLSTHTRRSSRYILRLLTFEYPISRVDDFIKLIVDPEGIWVLASNNEEVFIHESLFDYEHHGLIPSDPPLPPASPVPGPPNIPTLLCKPYIHLHYVNVLKSYSARSADCNFRGRKCKLCSGQDRHDPLCASIQESYRCLWCQQLNGIHELACGGFSPEHQEDGISPDLPETSVPDRSLACTNA